MVLRSEIFDDVYFSPEDGLAETRYVFLDGNNLPAAWGDKDEFVIAETGFGTGLNFLAAWALFEETAKTGQRLHFVSVEKYPLSREQILEALSVWDELSFRSEKLCDVYSIEADILDVQITDNVRLEVHFGDVGDVIVGWERPVDAWFLDGFKPSSNPDMWSDNVFENIGRLSRTGTSLATFTAVGFVRRGLNAVGFDIKRIDGFGWKWHMSVGVFR